MDLAITASILAFCAAVAFRLCQRYSLHHPRLAQIAAVCCLITATYLSWTSTYNLAWAEILPHGSTLFLSNASLLLVIVAAGLIFGDPRISTSRKQAVTIIFAVTAFAGIGSVLFRPLVQPLLLAADGEWKEDVCLQTHEASCAPAAAATLLGKYGVDTTEKEMAIHCLTSGNGTLSLAAFRGIHVGARRTGLGARAFVREPSTKSIDEHLPLFALVDFEIQLSASRAASSGPAAYGGNASESSPRKSKEGRHAVVLLERLKDGQYLVADPAVGKVRWTEEYFRHIWVGEGIYLVSK
ncbi:MAG: cysteine peptidase family C39 domain-containing protein [Planctomycetota bacterium]|nr:cysteine peptidase family C39 domain-containing protein [Planctomycetota bacterium]